MIPKLTGFPARYWWVLLVSGILALVAGVIVLVWPGRPLLLLTVVAAFWLIFYATMLLVSGQGLLAVALAFGIYLIASGCSLSSTRA